MSDNDYKNLLQDYEETPPPSAWNAVEKAIHKPWFLKPVFAGSVFLVVATVTALLIFSPQTVLRNAGNSTSAPEQGVTKRDEHTSSNDSGVTGKPEDPASPQSNSNSPKTATGSDGSGVVPSERSASSATSGDEPKGNVSVHNAEPNKAGDVPSSSASTYIPAGNSGGSRSLQIDSKTLCVGDVLPIRVNVNEENCMLYTGDGYSVALPKGRFVFPYKYNAAGTYRISVKRQNDELIGMSFVVYNKSVARFRTFISEGNLTAFENLSENAIGYRWLFGDGGNFLTESKMNIEHAFASSSVRQYAVKLIAINRNGCSDTFEMTVTNPRYRNYFNTPIPNVFTPNGDGMNDVFEIPVADLKEWQMIVVDERGNKVFETEHQGEYWNGKMNNTGVECSAGSYRYYITYRQPDDTETHQKSGFISLIR